MNVYDFDKTIYNGDSTLDFYIYCLKRYPWVIYYIPIQVLGSILYLLGVYNKVKFKEQFYSFLKCLDNVDEIIYKFWTLNENKIKDWYKHKKCSDDIIISASPEFLLDPICKRLGIKLLIASKVDKFSGKYTGENCHGEEKVNRLNKEVKDYVIKEFYSDSFTDSPLAALAIQSFIVVGNNTLNWSEYKPNQVKRITRTFLTRDFIMFLFIGLINTFNGILFSYIYSIFLNTNVAFIIGYLTSLAISYILNSSIIFKAKLQFIKFLKFCISYTPNFMIQNMVVIIFFNFMRWNKLIVYAQAAALGIPITFILMKGFTFKNIEKVNSNNYES